MRSTHLRRAKHALASCEARTCVVRSTHLRRAKHALAFCEARNRVTKQSRAACTERWPLDSRARHTGGVLVARSGAREDGLGQCYYYLRVSNSPGGRIF